MRKLFAAGSLVALTATLFLSTAGTALAIPEVSTFVGCDSLSATPVPSHECEIGDSPDGYLESTEQIFYDICTKHPNGETLCETNQSAGPHALFGNVIVAKEVGQYEVSWTKTGEGSTAYGHWAFTMSSAGPPPPPPPPTPPSTTPGQTTGAAPAAVPPPAACLADRARVKVLSAKLKKAGKKQKPKIKRKLRKARTAVATAC